MKCSSLMIRPTGYQCTVMYYVQENQISKKHCFRGYYNEFYVERRNHISGKMLNFIFVNMIILYLS